MDGADPAGADGAGNGTRPAAVRPMVLGSWRRSAGAHVDRQEQQLPPVLLDTDVLEPYRTEHPLTALLPVFRELLGRTAAADGLIWAVSDAEGTLLWVEGAAEVRKRAERMNFVPGAGWSEARAGTNAPGTALELGEPVQIVGTEHFKAAAAEWSCAAAPVRDPDSGQVLGVIDITGDRRLDSPAALLAVQATARAAQGELARAAAVADGLARARYLDRLEHAGEPLVLVSPAGRVLHAAPGIRARRLPGLAPGAARLLHGKRVVVEPVDGTGYLLVCLDGAHPGEAAAAPLHLNALGTDTAELRIGAHRVERLSRRHSEIVVALVLAGAGISGERLGLDLYGDESHPVTLRVELSRLRALLGEDVLGSRPYALSRPVAADFRTVSEHLAQGRLADALRSYAGPLLPASEAPAIVEYRTVLEQALRNALLAGHDPALLQRWLDTPWGSSDGYAWEVLARWLPSGSPQRAVAETRARALAS